MPRYINDIIVHCSATKAGEDFGAEDIKCWHKKRGWRTIGYHYVVRIDGTIEHGRAISAPGSHCIGHNAHSVGVVYVGGLDADGRPSDTRTAAQRASLLTLITRLVKMYRCDVHGHRDYAERDCPCFDAHAEYHNIYRQVVRGFASNC